MEKFREERMIRSSPQRVNTSVLQDFEQQGLHNNVIALGIQEQLHTIVNNSEYYSMQRKVRARLRRMQGLAFDGYYPPQGERKELLDEVESRRKSRDGSVMYRYMHESLQKIEGLITKQEHAWQTAQNLLEWAPEVVRYHQDSDAIIDFSSKLRGRILMFGSARKGPGTAEYDATKWMTQSIIEGTMREDGHTEHVLTGAGPGIMEAANEGAMRARYNLLKEHGGLTRRKHSEHTRKIVDNIRSSVVSAGIRIQLPFEAGWNEYLQFALTIKTFPPRKLGLNSTASGRSIADKKGEHIEHGRYPAIFVSDAFGFGTNDELWEALCAQQCRKMPNIPIIAIGKNIRASIQSSFDVMLENGTIDPKDVNYVQFVDNEVEALEAYLGHHKIKPSKRMTESIQSREPTIGAS